MADRKKYKYGLDKLRKKKKTVETFDFPLPPTVWKPKVARPGSIISQEGSGSGGTLTPEDKKIIKDNKARLIALQQGSRPVKARPMKGIPRKLKPELAKDAKARREKYKVGGPSKVGVRTGNNNLSKLVRSLNK